jgi:hypothetical protein
MSKKKGFDAFLVPESSIYRVEPGEYDLQLAPPTLGPADVIAIQEGEGEIRDNKMIIFEPSDVWIPEGTTLFPSISDLIGKVVGLIKPKKTDFRIAISPNAGRRSTSFKVAVRGVQKNNKVRIKVTKKSIISGRVNDPLLAAITGNGRTSFSGDELIRDMKLKPGTHTMYIYGEERLYGFNRFTKSVPIRISVSATAAPTISGGEFKVVVRPARGGPRDRFLFIVYNAKGGRQIDLNITKPGGWRLNDWLIGKTKGRGMGTTTPVYVNGATIASKLGIKPGTTRTLNVYAEEVYLGRNRYTNSIPVVFSMPRSAPSPGVTPTQDDGGDFRMTITPTQGGVNDRFTIRVFGSPSDTRKIRLCTSRLPPGPYDDPTFVTMPGNGVKVVSGADLLRGHPIMTRMPGADTVKVYARADIPKTIRNPWGIDKFTKPAISVTVHPDEGPMPEPDYEPTPTPTPTPVAPRCKEGYRRTPQSCPDGTTIYREVCRSGRWVPSGETCREDAGVPPAPAPTPAPTPVVCADGTRSADGKMVCSGGVWVPIVAAPEKEFLTPEEALARIRAGFPCYVKSTLPLLNLLPGLPYIEWLPLPPFCVIKATP